MVSQDELYVKIRHRFNAIKGDNRNILSEIKLSAKISKPFL